MEDITDADYTHTKGVCKDFEIKYWEKYHDLYVQSDTLFLADLFENFIVNWYMYLKIYELEPAPVFFQPLDWHGNQLQKDHNKIRFFQL